jgi:hypothetical protein
MEKLKKLKQILKISKIVYFFFIILKGFILYLLF